jgi:DNA-binding transcriptional MerR regulator
MSEELTIEDLEKHSGLSTRTLHYYMQIELLPSPEKRGVNATYSQEHLDRLDVILILKELHLPLKEIRSLLDRLTPEEIKHYRDDQEDLLHKIKADKPQPDLKHPSNHESSALDYIKNLEEAHSAHRNVAENPPMLFQNQQRHIFSTPESPTPGDRSKKTDQEIWRRIILADGVELHIRDTRDKGLRYKLDRLLSFAASLFKK